jgi:hypothetical protein
LSLSPDKTTPAGNRASGQHDRKHKGDETMTYFITYKPKLYVEVTVQVEATSHDEAVCKWRRSWIEDGETVPVLMRCVTTHSQG